MSKFTAKQKEIVARKLGYEGPMQGFDEFLQSSPALQMKYGMVADKYMAKGGVVKKYAAGGAVTFNIDLKTATAQQKADEYNRLIGAGFTDAQIRNAAGTQTDSDWSALTSLARASGSGVRADTGQQSPRVRPDTVTDASAFTVGDATSGATTKPVKLNIDTKTATAAQKAAEYNRLRSEGFTDAQIRAGVDSSLGTKQTDADWTALQGIASKAGTTIPKTTPATQYTETGVPIAGATQQVQAQQTSTEGLKLDPTDSAYKLGTAPTATVKTAGAAEQATAAPVAAGQTYTATTALPDVQEQMNKLLAEKGTVSEGAKAVAQQGTLSEGATAKTVAPATATTVTPVTPLKQTDEMLAKAATAADVGGMVVAAAAGVVVVAAAGIAAAVEFEDDAAAGNGGDNDDGSNHLDNYRFWW
jgi:hypothetical protein